MCEHKTEMSEASLGLYTWAGGLTHGLLAVLWTQIFICLNR